MVSFNATPHVPSCKNVSSPENSSLAFAVSVLFLYLIVKVIPSLAVIFQEKNPPSIKMLNIDL